MPIDLALAIDWYRQTAPNTRDFAEPHAKIRSFTHVVTAGFKPSSLPPPPNQRILVPPGQPSSAAGLSKHRGNTRLATAAKASPKTKARPRIKAPVDQAEHLRLQVIKAVEDLKAKDVREIDVRGKTSVTDLMVIASGTSSRHVRSIADEVLKLAKQIGVVPIGVEGQREAEWVLVDLGDIVVHVMLPRVREFYALERLWTVGDDMPESGALN